MKKIGLTGIIIFLIINLCLGANWEKIYDLNTIDHGFSEVIASKNGGYIGVTNLSTSTYLVKMNAVGDTIWTQNFSEGTFLRGIGVVEDTVSNDITFIGGSFNANNDRSIVLLRSDANGNELWRQVIGNPGDSLSPVHFINTSDGGFLVTGWSRSKSAFFLKTDGLGNTSWTKFYSDLTGNGELYGTSVAEIQGGGYIASGVHNYYSGPVGSLFLRLDANGDTTYTKLFLNPSNASSAVNHVLEEPNGNFVLITHQSGSNPSNPFTPAIRLVRMNNLGSVIHDHSNAVHTSHVNNNFSSVRLTSSGTILITGGAISGIIELYPVGTVKFEHTDSTYAFNINSDTVYHAHSAFETNSGGFIIAGHCTTMTASGWEYKPYVWSLDSLTQIVSGTSCASLSVSVTHSVSDSVAVANVSGGIGPYNYVWSTGSGTNGSSNPYDSTIAWNPGLYCVTVNDVSTGCTVDTCISSFLNCPGLSLTANLSSDSTYTIAQVSGGTAPYTYHWAPGLVSTLLSSVDSTLTHNLDTGYYCLTVVDDSNCADTFCLNIPLVSDPCANFNVYAQYFSTGIVNGDSATAYVVSGGTGPFQYQWTVGAITPTITNLASGFNYCVTVVDANGCFDTACASGPLNVDSVFPGDANANGVADVYDLLPIGLGYGNTGPVRANASLIWIGQYANNWSSQFLNGANYKHADCDGNGTINLVDAAAILLNYGLTHNKDDISAPALFTDPTLYLDPVSDTVQAGDSVSIPIILGDQNNLTHDIYGIAFELNYDTSIVEPGASITYGNTWLGTLNNDLIEIQKDLYSSSKIAAAAVRNDQTNVTGFGQIASLNIVMQDDLSGKTNIERDLHLSFSNVVAISNTEQVLPLNLGSNVMKVIQSGPVGLQDYPKPSVTVFPNPTARELWIECDDQISNWSLFDVQGRLVKTKMNLNRSMLHMEIEQVGYYILQVQTESSIDMVPIIVK